ncbi:hypothetical protein HOLleu_18035 [Holothuria leucospilota]|uniref:Uncharacterized protein n=1 Tax=Holothuria leucospilota TaxID=206669 RepID=A0A9Q1H961_HOLLE|nr:hypothetical protein HOLleu_18035 [Holothuria leucospilota]
MVVKLGANTSNNCCVSRFLPPALDEEILLVPEWMTIPGMWDFSCIREQAKREELYCNKGKNVICDPVPKSKTKKDFRPNVWKRKCRRSRRNNRRNGGAVKITYKDSSTENFGK